MDSLIFLYNSAICCDLCTVAESQIRAGKIEPLSVVSIIEQDIEATRRVPHRLALRRDNRPV